VVGAPWVCVFVLFVLYVGCCGRGGRGGGGGPLYCAINKQIGETSGRFHVKAILIAAKKLPVRNK
jgi:hypothetical protein